MKEVNKSTLKRAIEELPEYFPDPSNWSAIQSTLSQEELIGEAVPRLGEFAPPVDIWERIAADLEPRSKVVPMRNWRSVAAAAVMVGLVSAAVFLYQQSNRDATVLAFATEEVDHYPFSVDWDQDDADFDQILALYEERPFLKEQTNYHERMAELTELEEAKAEIQEMAELYGLDDDLIHKIKDIELERTTIAKDLIVIP